MSGCTNIEQNLQVDFFLRGQSYASRANSFIGLLKCSHGVIARSTAYALNNTVTVLTSNGILQFYKVTTAGTTAGSAPSYPGVVGEIITDGTVQFTEQSEASLENASAIPEVTGGGYARVTYANSLANWAGTQGAGTTVASNGTTGQTSNNNAVTFPQATANWNTAPEKIWGFGIWDAVSGGNLIRHGGLLAAVDVLNTNTPSFAAAALIIRVDR
jgi:hypothetical protein